MAKTSKSAVTTTKPALPTTKAQSAPQKNGRTITAPPATVKPSTKKG